MRNKTQVINDSDKNLVAAMADEMDVISQCKRHLYDFKTINET